MMIECAQLSSAHAVHLVASETTRWNERFFRALCECAAKLLVQQRVRYSPGGHSVFCMRARVVAVLAPWAGRAGLARGPTVVQGRQGVGPSWPVARVMDGAPGAGPSLSTPETSCVLRL